MYSDRPRDYKGRGTKALTNAISNAERFLAALKRTQAQHTANPAMDVVEALAGVNGHELWQLEHYLRDRAAEIQDAYPEFAQKMVAFAEGAAEISQGVTKLRNDVHMEYRRRQAEIILADLSRGTKQWLRDFPATPAVRVRADRLRRSEIDKMIAHHLIDRAGPPGYYGMLYLGRDVRQLLMRETTR